MPSSFISPTQRYSVKPLPNQPTEAQPTEAQSARIQSAKIQSAKNSDLNKTIQSDGHQHSQSVPHVHSEASKKRIANRLSRIEGHVRGIKSMVQDNRPCPDVLTQVAAVRGALDRVARLVLDEHLSECITRAADEGNIEGEVEALKAALDRFI